MNDMPWIKSYPPGVRWDAKIPLTPVQQILEESASKWPNNPAVDFMYFVMTLYVLSGVILLLTIRPAPAARASAAVPAH